MKKKIAIYGTGVDGRRLHRILRKKKNIRIICFLETDISKNNSKFFKLPVIHPKNINYKIDEIYLGGRYMDEQEIYLKKLKFKGTIIRTNRWEYKYTKKEILIREKILLKILKKLISIFKKNKINYSIDASSLLALYRNQKLAEFTDVDISVIDSEIKIKKLLNDLKKINTFSKKKFLFHKKKHFLFKKNSFLQCVLLSNCNIFKREPVAIEFYAEYKMKNDYYRFIPPNLISKVPEIFRNEVKDITYNNLKLKVPNRATQYLEHLYGKNWIKKDQNWKNTNSKKRFHLLSKFKKKK